MNKVIVLLITILLSGCNRNVDLVKSNDMDTLSCSGFIKLTSLNNSSVQDSLKLHFGDTLFLIKTDTIIDEETGFEDVNFIYVDNKKDSILLKEILKRPNVMGLTTQKKFSIRLYLPTGTLAYPVSKNKIQFEDSIHHSLYDKKDTSWRAIWKHTN